MIFPEETHVEQNISCQLFKLNVEHDPQSLHVFCQLYRDQTTLQSQISETLLSPRRFMREALRNCMRIEGWNIFKRKIRGELWSRQSCQCALIGTCLYLLRNLPLSPLQISGLAGLNMEIWRTADQFVWDERLLPVTGKSDEMICEMIVGDQVRNRALGWVWTLSIRECWSLIQSSPCPRYIKLSSSESSVISQHCKRSTPWAWPQRVRVPGTILMKGHLSCGQTFSEVRWWYDETLEMYWVWGW